MCLYMFLIPSDRDCHLCYHNYCNISWDLSTRDLIKELTLELPYLRTYLRVIKLLKNFPEIVGKLIF